MKNYKKFFEPPSSNHTQVTHNMIGFLIQNQNLKLYLTRYFRTINIQTIDLFTAKDYITLKDKLDKCIMIITDVKQPSYSWLVILGTAKIKKIPIVAFYKTNRYIRSVIYKLLSKKDIFIYSNKQELDDLLKNLHIPKAPHINTDYETRFEKLFKKFRIKYKDINVVYFDSQNANKEPLFFIHGIGGRAKSYAELLNLLTDKFHVIAIDLPYFGESDIPQQTWYYEDFGIFLITFIKKYVKTNKNLTIMGHSFGGALALEIDRQLKAIPHRDISIKRLILINSAGLKIDLSHPKLLYKFWIKKTLQDRSYKKSSIYINTGLDFTLSLLKNIEDRENFKKVKAMYKYLTKGNQKLIHYKTDTPSIIVWGKDDEIFDCCYLIRFLMHFTNFKLVVIDGNHDWPVFEPQKLLNALHS